MMWWWLLLGCVPDRSCLLVRHDGVDLPVCIEGQQDSDVVLLHLHGGPANTGGWLYTRYGLRQELKQHVLVASMDHRAMGSSKGVYGKKRITMEQLADDANEVVDVLREMYPDKEVWLHGHSFGGAVGTTALLQGSAADGWISEAGCHDPIENALLSRQRLLDHEPTGDGEVLDAWAELKEGVREEDAGTFDGHVAINGYANEADSLLGYDTVDNSEMGTLTWAAAMPFQLLQLVWPGSSAGGLLTEDGYGPVTAKLGRIEQPALYLSGELDFICTEELAVSATEVIGSERVGFASFPEGGHDFGDQFPVEVTDTILDFIEGEVVDTRL